MCIFSWLRASGLILDPSSARAKLRKQHGRKRYAVDQEFGITRKEFDIRKIRAGEGICRMKCRLKLHFFFFLFFVLEQLPPRHFSIENRATVSPQTLNLPFHHLLQLIFHFYPLIFSEVVNKVVIIYFFKLHYYWFYELYWVYTDNYKHHNYFVLNIKAKKMIAITRENLKWNRNTKY